MPDSRPSGEEHGIPIARAFAALPLETPDDAWPALAARLQRPAPHRRRRTRWPWLAAAAALALAVALPQALVERAPEPAVPPAVVAAPAELDRLMAESRSLEALIVAARDDATANGSAAAIGLELEDRLRLVDADLAAAADPDAAEPEVVALWQARVHLLRDLAALEATRLWLAGRGQDYELAVAAVD